MNQDLEICVICAWRETCKKKFSVSGRDLHCPDFSRDLSLKKEEEDKEEKKEKN